MCAQLLQLCRTLCDPMDCGLPGSSGHGILQARVLEWAARPSSRGTSRLRIELASLESPSPTGRFFTAEPLGKPINEDTEAPPQKKKLNALLLVSYRVSICTSKSIQTAPSSIPFLWGPAFTKKVISALQNYSFFEISNKNRIRK